MPDRRPRRGLRPEGCLRLLLLLATLLAAPATVAAAQDAFGALTITPFGDQTYDFATGVTTMAEGGTVVDRTHGVTLTGATLLVEEGRRIEATDAEVEGDFGRFEAAELVLDVDSGRLEASGGLTLSRDGLSLGADALVYHPDEEVAVLDGGVHGTLPDFEAARVVLDTATGDTLLVGPYRFVQAGFTLRSSQPGGLLQLTPVDLEGAVAYDAATEVGAALRERFAPFLDAVRPGD